MAKKSPHLSLVRKGPGPVAETAASKTGPGPNAETATDPAEIDDLYKKPLGEFTAARNALAKQRGKAGADLKTLEKPSPPAWAVNQLYWRERDAYDRLIDASEALRAEHRKHLSGKTADIRQAEKTHREAVRAASDTIRRLLGEAGETASAATMMAVTETLESLPTADAPGRLVRALKPQGFEALAGLAGFAARPAAVPAPAKPRKAEAASDEEAEAARQKEEAARRAAEAAEREAQEERERQRAAHAEALRAAEAAVEHARAALDEAHQEVERRLEALAEAREALRQLKRVTIT